MKKLWNKPEFEELNIRETAGGAHFNHSQDGKEWQDANGIWQIPVGDNNFSSGK